jgi:hypothetical protein
MSDADIWKQKILDYGARIATLMATDVQAFISGLIRDRFVASPEFADTLTDEVLAGVKVRAVGLAEGETTRLTEALTPACWLSAAVAAADAPITAHPQIRAAVQRLQTAADEFLAAEGFPGGASVVYRLPARFIDGENLPSLSRNYWKAVVELRRLESAAAGVEASDRADLRRARWDEA